MLKREREKHLGVVIRDKTEQNLDSVSSSVKNKIHKTLSIRAPKTLDNFCEYIKSEQGKKDLENLGVAINYVDNVVNLDGMESLRRKDNKFGHFFVHVGLRKLHNFFPDNLKNKVINYDGNNNVTNISIAKMILKVFFEYLGFEIFMNDNAYIKVLKFDDLELYLNYFSTKNGLQDIKNANVRYDNEKKEVDISRMLNPQNFKIRGMNGDAVLMNIYRLLPEREKAKIEGIDNQRFVQNIPLAKNIIKVLINYMLPDHIVITEKKKEKGLEGEPLFYKGKDKQVTLAEVDNYFKTWGGKEDLINAGIFFQGNYVDMKDIINPQSKDFRFGGLRAHSGLRYLLNLLIKENLFKDIEQIKGYTSDKQIKSKEFAKAILKSYLESRGYVVVTEGKIYIRHNLENKTIEECGEYIVSREGIKELSDAGITISGMYYSLDGMITPSNSKFKFMRQQAKAGLMNLYKSFPDELKEKIDDYNGTTQVKSKKLATKILALFFEKLGYQKVNLQTKKY